MISISAICNVPVRDVLKRSPVVDIPCAEATLMECIYRSYAVRYGYVDDQVACMWGLIRPTLLSESAYLWLLTTDLVEDHKFLFVRHSQRWLEGALQVYPMIVGDTDITNHSARRWLTWLGAEFSPSEDRRIKFVIRRKVLNG